MKMKMNRMGGIIRKMQAVQVEKMTIGELMRASMARGRSYISGLDPDGAAMGAGRIL